MLQEELFCNSIFYSLTWNLQEILLFPGIPHVPYASHITTLRYCVNQDGFYVF
jgi:hypothetical protein